MEEVKETFFEKFKRHPRRFQLNMPKKFGLTSLRHGKRIFLESENGYVMQVYNHDTDKLDWIGFPKWVVENNPQLYIEVEKE